MSEPKNGRKRPSARDSKSGRFEASTPFNDASHLYELVKVVRAIRDLEPLLAGTVLMFKQLGDDKSAALASMCGVYLSELKRGALEGLQTDPEMLRDAKKLRLEAKVLGNLPLAEQQRLQQLAAEWSLDGVTPAKLAGQRPEVLQSVMEVVAAVGVPYFADDGRSLGQDGASEVKP